MRPWISDLMNTELGANTSFRQLIVKTGRLGRSSPVVLAEDHEIMVGDDCTASRDRMSKQKTPINYFWAEPVVAQYLMRFDKITGNWPLTHHERTFIYLRLGK